MPTAVLAVAVALSVLVGAGAAAPASSAAAARARASATAYPIVPPRSVGTTSINPRRVRATVAAMRVVSYYPSRHPWGGMWSVWQPSVIGADMAKIAGLGANTVRVFVPPATFGYPVPAATYVSRLGQLLTIAASHGLRVQLTLFDLWSGYADLAGSEQWAARLLAPFRGDPRIAAVELQSEVEPTNARAMAWVRTMVPFVRAASGSPVTASVTGWNTPIALRRLIDALGRVKLDFYDLHFYGTPPYMLPTFRAARRMAGDTPLVIGESGYSTAPSNTSILGAAASQAVQEREQTDYFIDVERAAFVAHLPRVGVWVLNDFPRLAHLSRVEQHFGLYRVNGTPKPAAALIRKVFRGRW